MWWDRLEGFHNFVCLFKGRIQFFRPGSAGLGHVRSAAAAAADKSADVLVYEGLVGVGPPIIVEGGPKEEIEWPVEVSEKKWEEIILVRLQKLHISPDGTPGKPESFIPEKEEDEWVRWNQERDAKQIHSFSP